MPTLTIDNTKVEVPEGTSVLAACRQAGAKVPTLCYLENVQTIGACRVCLVEIEGAKTLVASCAQPAADGMVVHTASPKARRGRRTVVELLLSEHDGDCQTCNRSEDCELQAVARELGIKEISLAGERASRYKDASTPALRRAMNLDAALIHPYRIESDFDRVRNTAAFANFEPGLSPTTT